MIDSALAGRQTSVIRNIEDNHFFTSKASRNALPKSMNANTKIMMAMPGNMAKYASFRIM